MTKSELDALNQALVILDRESNRYNVYREGVEVFETATEALLAAIRQASIEVSEGTRRGGWYNRLYILWYAVRLVFS